MTANKFPTPCVEYKTNKYTLEALVKLKTFYWAPVLLHTLNGIPELKLAPLRGSFWRESRATAGIPSPMPCPAP